MRNEDTSPSMADVDLEVANDDGNTMPSADEVRQTHAMSGGDPASVKKSRRRCYLAAGAVLLIAIIGIIAGTAGGKGNERGNAANTGAPRPRPAPSPSRPASAPAPSPSGGNPIPPQPFMSNEERIERTIDFLRTTGISELADLQRIDSPQRRAVQWIGAEDGLRVPIPNPTTDFGTLMERKFIQRYALAVFYYATNGDDWFYPFSFLNPIDECEWYEVHSEGDEVYFWGAHCEGGTEEGLISQIWLPNNDMSGTIPPEIEVFRNIRVFAMEYNINMGGTIPNAFEYLKDLTVVVLSNNLFEGKIPETFRHLENLEFLALDDNKMEGNLAHVKRLSNLKFLYLEDNFFTGSLDDAHFANTPNIEQLDLSDNKFSGTVPTTLLNHELLTVLDLHDNEIGGTFPSSISSQHTLTYLALHKNLMTGPIPTSIRKLHALTDLDLSDNSFTGAIPSALGDLNLEYLFLGDNSWDRAPFPDFINGMTNLTELSLKHSNIEGSIPDLTNLQDLYLLDLDKNKLTGTIPKSLSKLGSLIVLMLNRNQLRGTIPTELATLPALGVLLVDGNGGLSGDLDFMCDANGMGTYFALGADCGGNNPSVTCSSQCCTVCCGDPNEKCEDKAWKANYDPIWELSYERYRFEFDSERR